LPFFKILKNSRIQTIFAEIGIVHKLLIIIDLSIIFKKNHDSLDSLYLMVENNYVIISFYFKTMEIVHNSNIRFDKLYIIRFDTI
jgi:hypothetical protein